MLSKAHRLPLILLITCVVIGLLAIGLYQWTTQASPMPSESITIRKGSRAFREMPAGIQEFPVIKAAGKPKYSTLDSCTCGESEPPSYCIVYYSSASERELRDILNPFAEQVRKRLPDQAHSFDLRIKTVPPTTRRTPVSRKSSPDT